MRTNDAYTLIITNPRALFFKTGFEHDIGTSTSQKQKIFILLIRKEVSPYLIKFLKPILLQVFWLKSKT